jgi:hypothetical protein
MLTVFSCAHGARHRLMCRSPGCGTKELAAFCAIKAVYPGLLMNCFIGCDPAR